MKIFNGFVLLLALSACSPKTQRKDPIFKYKQKVIYQVPAFYQLVCTGNGVVESYETFKDTYLYDVYTDDSGCPNWKLLESELKAK
jgi:hypothetical protein